MCANNVQFDTDVTWSRLWVSIRASSTRLSTVIVDNLAGWDRRTVSDGNESCPSADKRPFAHSIPGSLTRVNQSSLRLGQKFHIQRTIAQYDANFRCEHVQTGRFCIFIIQLTCYTNNYWWIASILLLPMLDWRRNHGSYAQASSNQHIGIKIEYNSL